MKLRWSKEAKADSAAIAKYIARDKPKAAYAWVNRLRERARQATTIPYAGRVVPEFGRNDVREVFLRTYRIIYRIEDGWIVVVKVVDGRKLLDGVDPDVQ